MSSEATELRCPVIIPVDYIPPLDAYERQLASIPFADEIVKEGQAHECATGDVVFGATDVRDAMPAIQISMMWLSDAIIARLLALASENPLINEAETLAALLAIERSGMDPAPAEMVAALLPYANRAYYCIGSYSAELLRLAAIPRVSFFVKVPAGPGSSSPSDTSWTRRTLLYPPPPK